MIECELLELCIITIGLFVYFIFLNEYGVKAIFCKVSQRDNLSNYPRTSHKYFGNVTQILAAFSRTCDIKISH